MLAAGVVAAAVAVFRSLVGDRISEIPLEGGAPRGVAYLEQLTNGPEEV